MRMVLFFYDNWPWENVSERSAYNKWGSPENGQA